MASTMATSPQPQPPLSKSTSPTTTFTTPTLHSLPSEILLKILYHLPNPTLKSLRLSSRLLNQHSTPLLLHTLPLLFTTRSFTRLLSLARCPHLAPYVQVIDYNTMILNERGTYTDYKEWQASQAGMSLMLPEPGVGLTFAPPNFFDTPVKQVAARTPKMHHFTRQRLYHERWTALFAEQQSLLKPGVEISLLSELLALLPALKEIRMGCHAQAFVDYYDCIWKGNGWVILWHHQRRWLEGERRKFVDGGGDGGRRGALKMAMRAVGCEERIRVVVEESIAARISVHDLERGWPWF
ncbi:hypothetical protein VTL71DRAFT_2913 [Oculimacula yallundae]|uniref:F-box domain-containing protein n=1 Tax=Oculimacula yallundae TaxID=86028 RepID=A0ABR4C5L9_9HELO